MNAGSRQPGIALVSVLLILSAVLMLAVGTLLMTQSNLMVSENLVSSSIARNNADAGIDATAAVLFEVFKQTGEVPSTPPNVPSVWGTPGTLAFSAAPTQNGTPWYVKVSDTRVSLRMLGTGPRNAEYLAEALIEFGGDFSGGGSPFRGAVVACESVNLSGSGRIDSFDSRVGPYLQHSPGYQADVLTLSSNGTLQITGDAPIYGDVAAAGGVRATGSSPIYGDIHANGFVELNAGGGVYPGSVMTQGNVSFGSSSIVHGNVLANGNIHLGNWGARINSNAQAGGTITGAANPLSTHVPNGTIRSNTSPSVQPVPTEDCDPLDIPSVTAGFSSLPSHGNLAPDWWPYKAWELSPDGARRRDESNGQWENTSFVSVEHQVFGRQMKVLKVNDFNLGAGEQTRITGGDVVLVVSGNFSAGGSHSIHIDPGSSLTIFVAGTTNLGASFEVLETGASPKRAPSPVNSSGLPTFSIFSSYDRNNGVTLSGNGKLTASIYAPLTDVSFKGSGETDGALRARNINVSGGAGLHYDEALGAIDIGGGQGTVEMDPTVRIVSRR